MSWFSSDDGWFSGESWAEAFTKPFVNFGAMLIEAAARRGFEVVKDQVFDKVEDYKASVSEATLKYFDELVGEPGVIKNPIGGVASTAKKVHLLIIGISLAIGLGAEYWVSRRKDFSWTRGFMYGGVMYSTTVASSQMLGMQLALDAIPLQDVHIDTVELRGHLEDFLDNLSYATSFPNI